MNRPFWLDILYVCADLAPPIAIAAVASVMIARSYAWSGPTRLGAYLVISVASLGLWLAVLIAWSRLRPKSRRDGDSESE